MYDRQRLESTIINASRVWFVPMFTESSLLALISHDEFRQTKSIQVYDGISNVLNYKVWKYACRYYMCWILWSCYGFDIVMWHTGEIKLHHNGCWCFSALNLHIVLLSYIAINSATLSCLYLYLYLYRNVILDILGWYRVKSQQFIWSS